MRRAIAWGILWSVVAWSFAGCAAPPAPSAQAQQIGALVAAAHESGHFEGVVLVADRGTVVFEQAYGRTAGSQSAPTTVTTPFPIASVTKLFTAVLIMQLAEQGRLTLDDPIARYLPEFPEAGQQITVRQLLTFTSGLPNYELTTVNPIDAYREARSLDTFIATYLQATPETTPGTRFAYNNGDYILLTKIIETASGQSWPSLLHAQILEPLGMRNSGIIGVDVPSTALARGTFLEQGQAQPDPDYRAENYFGAGAMYATAADLLKFERGLADGRLLDAATRTQMLTPDPKLGGVALGSWIYDMPLGEASRRVREIRGATWGIGSALVSFVEDERTIIVLANRRDLQASQIETLTQQIAAALYMSPAPNTARAASAQ